jgi:flagellar protein FlbT
MPLTLRVKPGHRLIINGAVIENRSPRAVQFDVLNRATVLLEDDLILPEDARTPLEEAYLAVQMMHLEPERYDEFYPAFIAGAAKGAAAALQGDRPDDLAIVQQAVTAVSERHFPNAMLRLQKVMGGKPGRTRSSKVLEVND